MVRACVRACVRAGGRAGADLQGCGQEVFGGQRVRDERAVQQRRAHAREEARHVHAVRLLPKANLGVHVSNTTVNGGKCWKANGSPAYRICEELPQERKIG